MLEARLITLFMAMMPVVELRGAIPAGVSLGLSIQESFILAVIGNLIPVPFLIMFTRSVFAWLRTKSSWLNSFVSRMENKAEKNKNLVLKYEFFGLILLVAVPLPGTGAWTGALVAAMMDMQLKRAIPACAIGVLIAGIIVTILTYGATALL